MAKEPLTITVDPDSELARVLDAADARPVVLDSRGVRYRVEPEDVFARYDPRQALAALRRGRGALKGVDTDKLLADLAEQREQDSVDRPAR
jgi:hypothetical protein